MISRALLNAPFFIPKDADLLRNRKVNTKKRQNRHLPELAFLILGTYFTASILVFNQDCELVSQLPKSNMYEYLITLKVYNVYMNLKSTRKNSVDFS